MNLLDIHVELDYFQEIVHKFSFHNGDKFNTPNGVFYLTPRKFLESEDQKFDPG